MPPSGNRHPSQLLVIPLFHLGYSLQNSYHIRESFLRLLVDIYRITTSKITLNNYLSSIVPCAVIQTLNRLNKISLNAKHASKPQIRSQTRLSTVFRRSRTMRHPRRDRTLHQIQLQHCTTRTQAPVLAHRYVDRYLSFECRLSLRRLETYLL